MRHNLGHYYSCTRSKKVFVKKDAMIDLYEEGFSDIRYFGRTFFFLFKEFFNTIFYAKLNNLFVSKVC